MNSPAVYIHAIRGPVLLVLLGALMLVDHHTDLSFWRTWPLLLVAGGLMVLAERAAVRENPWAAAPPPTTPPPVPSTIAYRPFGHPDPEPPRSGDSEHHAGGGTQS